MKDKTRVLCVVSQDEVPGAVVMLLLPEAGVVFEPQVIDEDVTYGQVIKDKLGLEKHETEIVVAAVVAGKLGV